MPWRAIQKGFTLLEILIAASITVIVIAAVYRLLGFALVASTGMDARSIAETELEDLGQRIRRDYALRYLPRPDEEPNPSAQLVYSSAFDSPAAPGLCNTLGNSPCFGLRVQQRKSAARPEADPITYVTSLTPAATPVAYRTVPHIIDPLPVALTDRLKAIVEVGSRDGGAALYPISPRVISTVACFKYLEECPFSPQIPSSAYLAVELGSLYRSPDGQIHSLRKVLILRPDLRSPGIELIRTSAAILRGGERK